MVFGLPALPVGTITKRSQTVHNRGNRAATQPDGEIRKRGDSTMKTTTLLTCAVILLSVMLVVSFHQLTFAQTETTESEQVKLNTVSLDFTSAQVDPSVGNQVVCAFY